MDDFAPEVDDDPDVEVSDFEVSDFEESDVEESDFDEPESDEPDPGVEVEESLELPPEAALDDEPERLSVR